MKINVFTILILSFVTLSWCYVLNDRPIIGIFAQKLSDFIPGVNKSSYIAASYVKYLEGAGARVVPILTTTSKEELSDLFSYINGALIPGGDADLVDSLVRTNVEIIYKLAVKATDSENVFPLWGTCMGLQLLSVITAGTDAVISNSIGTWDRSLPLNFTEEAAESKMLKEAPMAVTKILKTLNVTYNAHYNCVSSDTYSKNRKLNSFFKVLSTNVDANGVSFMSTIEGINYPFYGTQWHPEMNTYQFAAADDLGHHINHSKEAVLITQYFADFFVNQARKSKHRFPDKTTENKYLIYNYEPLFSSKLGLFDEQMYVF